MKALGVIGSKLDTTVEKYSKHISFCHLIDRAEVPPCTIESIRSPSAFFRASLKFIAKRPKAKALHVYRIKKSVATTFSSHESDSTAGNL